MSRHLQHGLLFLLFCLLATPGTDAAEKAPRVWQLRELAKAPVELIPLLDERQRVIRTIETRQVVWLYSVFSRILDAAELDAEMFIMEGKDPNAFATNGEHGENIIAMNFGMLDMIGNDIHAAAAIIGHELAHLKLNHRDESIDAINRNRNGMLTAENTKYSRDNEREADYLGMIWTIEAGYEPEGAVRVHEALFELARRGGAFVGSHPSSIERITVLKSLARRLGRPSP